MTTEAQLKKQDELRALASHPNIRKLLDVIAWAEGADYDTLVGGGKFSDFSRHPQKAVHIKRLGTNSTAAGRYQFMNRTWNGEPGKNNGLRHQYGFTDFSPETQDMAAVALIKRRGALEDALRGDWQAVVDNRGMNLEWASFPQDAHKQGGKSRSRMLARLGDTTAPSVMGASYTPPPPRRPGLPPEMTLPVETPLTLALGLNKPSPQPALTSNPFLIPDREPDPSLHFNLDGQGHTAWPESMEEENMFDSFRPHNDTIRGRLFQMLSELGQAETQLQPQVNPFNEYPDVFDDRLLNIIDQVQV